MLLFQDDFEMYKFFLKYYYDSEDIHISKF